MERREINMGFLSGIFRSRDKPVDGTCENAYSFFMGGATSGKRVKERTAMQITAVPLPVWVTPEMLRPLVQQLGLAALPVYSNGWLVGAALLGICVCALVSVVWVKAELE